MFPLFDVVSLTDHDVQFFDAIHLVFSVPPYRTINAGVLFFAI